jgi:LmbE family N-acetylglucosaminyl deacetylase
MIDVLVRLAAGLPIEEPAAIVVAHFDDETFSLGGTLHLFRDLTLIHVTDGGHAEPRAWVHAGVSSYKQYVAMRRLELQVALEVGGWQVKHHQVYGVRDRGVVHALAEVEAQLRCDLRGIQVVFTHPYEGGHPDHDALAFLVSRVVDASRRYEFASYHLGLTGRMVGRFCQDEAYPAFDRTIHGNALARKTSAFAAYASQRGIGAWFDLTRETYRRAPIYDMTAMPPPGRCLYERKRFMASAVWRQCVQEYAA